MKAYTNKDKALDALAGSALVASLLLLYCAACMLDLAITAP